MMLELLWWVGLAWCAAWVALPLLALPLVGPVAGVVLWAVLAPWSALLGMGIAHRLLPRSEAGTFRFPGDPRSRRWALGSWAPSLYLALFQPVYCNSRRFQRLVLQVFGARLGADAWITSRTVIREPDHVRVGARSLVGEHAHLVCSYQPRAGLMVVGDIVIGDDTLVGAYTHVAPGADIGAHCIIEHAVTLGARTRVGDGTRIGAGSAIYNGVRIGRRVVIGKNCIVVAGTVIEDGACIPDGTLVRRPRRARAAMEAP